MRLAILRRGEWVSLDTNIVHISEQASGILQRCLAQICFDSSVFREKTRFNNIFWSDNFMLRDKAEIYLEFLKTRNILSSIKRKSNKPAGSYYVQF